jgi:hypothetical protein
MRFACAASIRSIEPRKAGAPCGDVSLGEALAAHDIVASAATHVAA